MPNGARILVQQRAEVWTDRTIGELQPYSRERLPDRPRTRLPGSQFLNGSVTQKGYRPARVAMTGGTSGRRSERSRTGKP